MPSLPEHELIYIGRPWIYRGAGLFFLTLSAIVAVSLFMSGALHASLQTTWPFYAIVGGVFAPASLWMLTRPSIRLSLDRAADILTIERVGLSGRLSSTIMPLADIVAISPITESSTDSDAHYVDIIGRQGERLRLSASQLSGRRQAERLARTISERIEARR